MISDNGFNSFARAGGREVDVGRVAVLSAFPIPLGVQGDGACVDGRASRF